MKYNMPTVMHWFLAIMAFLAVACKSKDWDISSLKVIETTPAANATDVAVSTRITASFSKKIKPTNYSVSVTRAGQPVTGSTSATDTAIIFTPSAPLAVSSDYIVVIAGTVEDTGGNPMGAEYRWTFRTLGSPGCLGARGYAFLGGSGTEYGSSVVKTPDGGCAVITNAGYADIPGLQGRVPLIPYAGGSDAVLFKLAADGSLSWYTFLGGSGGENGFSMSGTSDGGFIVNGQSAGFTSLGGKTPVNAAVPGNNTVVIRLTALGSVDWVTFFGSGSDPIGSAAIQTSDGGFVASGSANGNIAILEGKTPLTAYTGATDTVVVRLTSSGSVVWYTFIGGAGQDYARSLVQAGDGSFLVGIDSNSSLATLGGQSPLNNYAGSYDIMLVKLTSAGAVQWYTYIGGTGDDYSQSAIQSTDNGFLILGWSYANIPTLNGMTPKNPFAAMSDILAVKLTSAGAVSWHTFIGGSNLDSAYQAMEASDGSFTIAGLAEGNIVLPGLTPRNAYTAMRDVVVVNLSAAGVANWYTFFGGSGTDWGVSIVQDFDGGYLVSGTSGGLTSFAGFAPVYPAAGSYDVLLLKIKSDGNFQ